MDLYNKYGYITFPKGFKFYHSTNKILDDTKYDEYDNTLFCTIGSKYGSSTNTYEIELKNDYKVLFMVKSMQNFSLGSALVDIAKNVNYLPDVGDTVIGYKKYRKYRKKIISYLRKHDIYGWYTPTEEKLDTEVCFFPNNMTQFTIKQIDKSNIFDSLYTLKPVLSDNIKLKYDKDILEKYMIEYMEYKTKGGYDYSYLNTVRIYKYNNTNKSIQEIDNEYKNKFITKEKKDDESTLKWLYCDAYLKKIIEISHIKTDLLIKLVNKYPSVRFSCRDLDLMDYDNTTVNKLYPHIYELDIKGYIEFTNEDLGKMCNLVSLNLYINKYITDNGLKKLINLKTLVLWYNKIITVEMINSLKIKGVDIIENP